jgi:hypothetical protein
MGKRGTIAVRAKRTSGKKISLSGDYLKPTVGMTQRGRTVWKQVLSAFPTEYFNEGDRILLEQYCEAAVLHRSSTAFLNNKGRYYLDRSGIEHRYLAAEDQRRARYECAMLATKLRITKHAMISPKVAGRAALDAADAAGVQNGFEDLLFGGDETRQ